jgi:hypothetical protein
MVLEKKSIKVSLLGLAATLTSLQTSAQVFGDSSNPISGLQPNLPTEQLARVGVAIFFLYAFSYILLRIWDYLFGENPGDNPIDEHGFEYREGISTGLLGGSLFTSLYLETTGRLEALANFAELVGIGIIYLAISLLPVAVFIGVSKVAYDNFDTLGGWTGILGFVAGAILGHILPFNWLSGLWGGFRIVDFFAPAIVGSIFMFWVPKTIGGRDVDDLMQRGLAALDQRAGGRGADLYERITSRTILEHTNAAGTGTQGCNNLVYQSELEQNPTGNVHTLTGPGALAMAGGTDVDGYECPKCNAEGAWDENQVGTLTMDFKRLN